jgi:flagellar biosynthesis protein FlhF
MEVKKFVGETLQLTLDQVKAALGPEAVILQTRNVKKNLFSPKKVEITAAASHRSLQKKAGTEARIRNPAEFKSLPAKRQADVIERYAQRSTVFSDGPSELSLPKPDKTAFNFSSPITTKRYIDIDDEKKSIDLTPQLDSLQKQIHDLQEQQKQMTEQSQSLAQLIMCSFETPIYSDIFESLILMGIDRKYAVSFIKLLQFDFGEKPQHSFERLMESVMTEIISDFPVAPIFTETTSKATLMGLIGPCGSGKTTMAAKIAAIAKKDHKKNVGLIFLKLSDSDSFDQIAAYAKIFGIPFRVCSSAADFNSAAQDFSCLDMIICDTDSISLTPQNIFDLKKIISSHEAFSWHWVLPAFMRETDIFLLFKKIDIFAHGIFFTHLDQTKTFGCLYNICKKMRLPVLGYSLGKKVPDDLEQATAERMVSFLMNDQ